MDARKLSQAAVIWMTIAYVVCVLFVAYLPGLAESVMALMFHGIAISTSATITLGSAVLGLIYLDVFTAVGTYLFAAIYKKLR